MVKKEQKNYETIFILDAVLEDEKLEALLNKYTAFLTKNDCTIVKVDKWGRKKFAYPIKKKNSGHYVSIEFTGDPGIIAKLERVYYLDESILRFLTVSFDKKTLTERNAYFERKQIDMANRERESAAAAEAQEQALQRIEAPVEEKTQETEQQEDKQV
ncbi:MAG: 30S ribosomal protein S6 [Ignavibacteriae bacterium]|nr:MAG: 30S ribosomal protein S6 [Ignavibacteriota bacterium]